MNKMNLRAQRLRRLLTVKKGDLVVPTRGLSICDDHGSGVEVVDPDGNRFIDLWLVLRCCRRARQPRV